MKTTKTTKSELELLFETAMTPTSPTRAERISLARGEIEDTVLPMSERELLEVAADVQEQEAMPLVHDPEMNRQKDISNRIVWRCKDIISAITSADELEQSVPDPTRRTDKLSEMIEERRRKVDKAIHELKVLGAQLPPLDSRDHEEVEKEPEGFAEMIMATVDEEEVAGKE